jgi:integrase
LTLTHNRERGTRTFKRKEAADAVAVDMETLLRRGQLDSAFGLLQDSARHGTTLAEFWREWMQGEHSWKYTTRRCYERAWEEHLDAALGALELKNITYRTIKEFVTILRDKGLASESVKVYLTPLRSCLSEAVREELIPFNPTAEVRVANDVRTVMDLEDAEVIAYSDEECAKILSAAETFGFKDYLLVLIAIRTGLRESEICGLQPDSVDIPNRRIRVKRQAINGREDTPKGKRSRMVDATPVVCQALEDAVNGVQTRNMVTGKAVPWIFMDQSGERVLYSTTVPKIWKKIVKKAAVRYLSFHKLRHTYATQMIARGADPKYLQAQMGHADLSMTMDTYGHLFPGQFSHIADLMDQPVRAQVQ